jgi:excisionase family DNA binding protein
MVAGDNRQSTCHGRATVNPSQRYITIGDVCRAIGVGETRIRRLCNAGKIPFERVGTLRLFRPEDVPVIRSLCEREGYIKATTEAAAHAD